ncbi:hypothetical protein A2954_04570 [Candidatus Roizmanbacteria bacterium RIFCSPLOWO2_01_FULL_37_12]|uniref:DUF5615 domain-containing protein n=1 Tax=Candidatus Roizmanbacteria bacterium RIFCSPLOWO2_01_FULL_37_12 TaxID=1802056 RepID=A0A1F7IFW3_9BACT|nr:MAG: hypothetical protein A3D76_02495 [Candidatus Roizmanbacteria bacterium RIFCSPHIGHO2_02_FULL_37_9b]OGK42255.1 MAG: hypothetical protein A2954_04570 [Candidatus Roizmanbacteria bacterium RIFCSPLOWO2_01_FULL_37_12]
MFQILVDECVHFDLIKALELEGFHLIHPKDIGLTSIPDEEIFSYAQKHNLVILTFDKGYGNAIKFDILKSSGIVVVEIDKLSKQTIVNKTINFLNKVTGKTLKGRLSVIGPARVRTYPKN